LQTKFPEPREHIEAAASKIGSWEGEVVQTTADGRQVIAASRWYLRPAEQGEPAAFLEIHSDISEKKAAEQAAQEKEHLATIGTTAAIFAHEVSNPLNGLSVALQNASG
jgi:two-component system, LuxR family, sensor kinase FixL